MTRKFRTFVPGGLQKSVTLPDGTSSNSGTQIAGFAGQILTIDQLKTLLGLNNPNTQTSSGGSSGGSGTAAITLGQGLAGGGPLIGNVRINPVSVGAGMFAEDAPDEQLTVPGPAGQRGLPGVGLPGPAVYLTPDEPTEDFNVVPGPRGVTGPQGPQGNPGVGGDASAPVVFFPDDQPDEVVIPVGPRGPAGAAGATGPIGPAGVSIWIPTDEASDEPILFGLPVSAAGGGGGGSGANPTAKVGPTATNGSATTFLRSDGAPAIDLTATYTWLTGTHQFTGPIGASTSLTGISLGSVAGQAQINFQDSSGGTNAKLARFYLNTTTFGVGFLNDANTVGDDILTATRSGVAVSTISIGNTTDKPPITLNGPITVPAPPSGAALAITCASSGATALTLNGNTSTGVRIGFVDGNTGNQNFLLGVGVTAVGTFELFDNTNLLTRFAVSSAGIIKGYGPVAAALVDMTPDASTFTGTLTGMTATVTNTCRWSRNGNQVTLVIGNAVGTSSANTLTMTGLPPAIQPAHTQLLAVAIEAMESGSALAVNVSATVTASSGTITFSLNGSTTGWGTSLGKGVASDFTVTYLLN